MSSSYSVTIRRLVLSYSDSVSAGNEDRGAETEKEYSTTKTSWTGEEIRDTLQLLKLLHGMLFLVLHILIYAMLFDLLCCFTANSSKFMHIVLTISEWIFSST